jgi:hypothetical protein
MNGNDKICRLADAADSSVSQLKTEAQKKEQGQTL